MPIDAILNAVTSIQTLMGYLSYGSPYILLLMLLFLVPGLWLVYVRAYYLNVTTKYILIELKPPQEVRKTPRAMEQVFTAIHSLRSGPELMFPAVLQEKWWHGEVVLHYSAEIASFGGEIHFYMWIPEKHRNIIESALYSHYSDLEIKRADDYVDRLPRTFAGLKERKYEIFGTEFTLVKKDEEPYPIRTYVEFEAVAEEKELDPISGVLEVMGGIRPQDTMWVQILVQPLYGDQDRAFRRKGELFLNGLKASARSVKNEITGEIHMVMPSPGETEAMKAIDRKTTKPAFNTVIRTIYTGPKEGFSSNFGQRAVISAFNQYASESFNKFRNNSLVWTRANMWYPPFIFPRRRLLGKKERVLANYRERKIYDDTVTGKLLRLELFNFGLSGKMFILNSEELATLYHLPTVIVLTGPIVKKEGTRKAGPPAGLPIYGGGSEDLPLE